MAFVAGVDWGGALHAVCVVDTGSGAVAERFVARHDANGLRALAGRLARLGDAAALPVAIERPSGLIVDVLVAAGHWQPQPGQILDPFAVRPDRNHG